jgi:hypothetical protein
MCRELTPTDCYTSRPKALEFKAARFAAVVTFDYLVFAEPRLDRRTALTLPLAPPPQKN